MFSFFITPFLASKLLYGKCKKRQKRPTVDKKMLQFFYNFSAKVSESGRKQGKNLRCFALGVNCEQSR